MSTRFARSLRSPNGKARRVSRTSTNILAFLQQHSAQGEIGQKFQFTAFNLEVQQFEKLQIRVDGNVVNPTANDTVFVTTADLAGAVTEDVSNPNLSDSGTIKFDDFDVTDSHTVSVVSDPSNTLGAVVTDSATGVGDGTVTWSCNVANAATQYLAAGLQSSAPHGRPSADGFCIQ